jgi:WD40 repeat protein
MASDTRTIIFKWRIRWIDLFLACRVKLDCTFNKYSEKSCFTRTEKELAGMDDAHEGMIWDMSWHPLGHMLVSGSNDHTT